MSDRHVIQLHTVPKSLIDYCIYLYSYTYIYIHLYIFIYLYIHVQYMSIQYQDLLLTEPTRSLLVLLTRCPMLCPSPTGHPRSPSLWQLKSSSTSTFILALATPSSAWQCSLLIPLSAVRGRFRRCFEGISFECNVSVLVGILLYTGINRLAASSVVKLLAVWYCYNC